MIATTQDQSSRLLRCGVSADTADMALINGTLILESYNETKSPIDDFIHDYELRPAWSLSALLELLPKEIKSDGTTYKLNIDYPPIGQVAVRYNTEEDDLDSLFGLMGDDLFELIVLMVDKLAANGYKLNKQ